MFGLKTLTTVFLAASSVVASPLTPRQNAGAILAGLDATEANLVRLNQTFNRLTPLNPANMATAVTILRISNEIAQNLRDLKTRADQIPPRLNEDDSLNIAARVGELQRPIASTLNNIVVKKPYIRRAIFGFGDLSKTVLESLKTQRSLIGEFGAALTPKIFADFEFLGPALTKETQDLFNTAIAAYENCTGAVCLPPISFSGSRTPIPS